MSNRRFTLSEAEHNSLLHSFNTCKDASERIRYQAVRLYGDGYNAEEVLSITGCSRSSLQNWCRDYRKDSSQGLVDKRQGGNRAYLDPL